MHKLRAPPFVYLGQDSNTQLGRSGESSEWVRTLGRNVQELFISLSDREHPNRFPSDIPEDDLISFFTLSVIDKGLVLNRRGDHNRLGFAVQLCTLRYLGYCPDGYWQLDCRGWNHQRISTPAAIPAQLATYWYLKTYFLGFRTAFLFQIMHLLYKCFLMFLYDWFIHKKPCESLKNFCIKINVLSLDRELLGTH